MSSHDPSSERDPKRALVIVASLIVTVLGLAGALVLGSWGFDLRRYVQHEDRLQRLQDKKPHLEIVVQALEDEGSPLAGQADDEAELRVLAERHAGPKVREVLEKGRASAHTRVFRAADMIYFIYFDGDGVMRGFTCVSG
jgi:hypothetical protein